MSDIQHANWSETAGSNNAATPNGWPEGQDPGTVNDCAREMMGAVKREWNRSHVTISSTGSANAYVLTYTTAPTLTNGMIFAFKASFSNTGASTVNVNVLGAIDIVKQTNAGQVALIDGDIVATQHVLLSYDSTTGDAVLLNPQSYVATTATESLIIPITTEAGFVTAGTGKVTFRMPYAFTVTAVRASLQTAQTSGTVVTVDINDGGVSILSTKLTIDNAEKTSVTAATPAVISDSALASDAEVTIDVDSIGDGTAIGLKVTIIGHQ